MNARGACICSVNYISVFETSVEQEQFVLLQISTVSNFRFKSKFSFSLHRILESLFIQRIVCYHQQAESKLVMSHNS